ncbi:MAG: hypothetical protein GQ569_12145, partial [Methylococcaceae bacterium]|nr:hypothetical protein [Methylococcaceae bacterium]
SEKLPFFQDLQTVEALSKEPWYLKTHVEKAGSREIATTYDLSKYDFAFPAGIPAATKISREKNIKKSYQPFFTPMVIASWKPIAEVLMANGIVKQRENAYYIVNMSKLFELIINKTRWIDLIDSDKYPANKSILVRTTDIRTSNSAAMYLALASYVFNGNAIVQNEAQINQIIDQLASLFLRQGFTENSSAIPFQDYLTMGPGKSPLVMMYEAQFLSEAAKDNSAISQDMVLLYPEPTLFTKHILIPFNEKGEKLGEALSTDETLQKIATAHGLRSKNTHLFKDFIKAKNLNVPTSLVNITEPPSYAILERMITIIEQRYARR